MECPICVRTTDAQPCECGYDFETGDRSRAARRAEIVKLRSTRKAWLGFVVLFVTLPLSILISIKLAATGVAALLMMVQLVFGGGALVRGLSWRRAAQARLSRATQQAKLPAARIVE